MTPDDLNTLMLPDGIDSFDQIKVGTRFSMIVDDDEPEEMIWRVTGIVRDRQALVMVCETDARDPDWHLNGPPYAVREVVWDEDDIGGLTLIGEGQQ